METEIVHALIRETSRDFWVELKCEHLLSKKQLVKCFKSACPQYQDIRFRLIHDNSISEALINFEEKQFSISI